MSGDAEEDFFSKLLGEDAKEGKRSPAQRDAGMGGIVTPEDFVIPPLRRDRAYTAFRLAQNCERMHVDRGAQPSRFYAYHYLVEMNFDPALESIFTLFFTSATVEVTGDRLWPVVYAIWKGRCESIHVYHPQLYERPPKNTPIIDAITLRSPVAPFPDEE